MKKGKGIVVIMWSLLLLSFTVEPLVNIKGWALRGSEPESYEMSVVEDVDRKGKVGYLKSTKTKIKGFGTVMQEFFPEEFLGKRVKLTGYIKSKDVAVWAGMWMRVDGLMGKDNKREVLSFDNMGDRKIKGTTDWAKYEIVLDVPIEATNIGYGVLLSGTGEIWLDDLSFQIVDDKAESTTSTKKTAPTNTSFED